MLLVAITKVGVAFTEILCTAVFVHPDAVVLPVTVKFAFEGGLTT